MKLTLTNAQIYNAKDPFQKLVLAKMPLMTGYDLISLIKALQPQADILVETRDKLIEQYGEKHPNIPGGFQMSPKMKGFVKFSEEFGKLLDLKVEVDVGRVHLPIPIPRTIAIEPYVLMALEKFVELDQGRRKKPQR